MKCLMIRPVYVCDILDGIKTIEYRNWPTKFRGDFLIGSTATKYTNSCVCAVASLDDVTYNEEEDIYEWHLSNIREIKPLPIRGQQRLFESGIDEYEVIDGLPIEEIQAIMEEVDTWLLKEPKPKTA